MASRGSVLRAQPRQALTDELVLLVRWCGLLLRIMLATLAYKHVLKECLPGQFALTFLSTLYGLSIVQLLPGASTSRGSALLMAISSRLLPHNLRGEQPELGEPSGLDDRSERPITTNSGERSTHIAQRTGDSQVTSGSKNITRREKGTANGTRNQLHVTGR